MTKSIIDKLQIARELLFSGEYTRALRVLKATSPAHSERKFQVEYLQLLSDILHCLGEYNEAKEASDKCLRLQKGRRERQYAHQIHLHGKILQKLGRTEDAVESYSESYTLFQLLGRYNEAVLPLDSLTALHFMKGDYSAAVRTLQQTIDICLSNGLARHLPRCRNNQARLLLRLGDFLRAMKVLRRVLSDESNAQAHTSAIRLTGMIQAMRRQDQAARIQLRKAARHYHRTGSTRDEVVCLEYLGLNEHFAGNQLAARKYFEDILSRDEITASARAQTLRMLTDVYIAEHDYAKAARTADLAEEAITRINERVEAGCLHRSRMWLAAAAADNNGVRHHFAEALDMFQLIGAKYELAETYLAGGRIGIFDTVSRREFLKQATLLFVNCGVTVRAKIASDELVSLLPKIDPGPDPFSSPLTEAYLLAQLL